MELLLAFLMGVTSSAVVAYVVYRKQRRESLQAEAALLQRLAEHGEVLGFAAATSLQAVGSTERLERDVSILRRQVTTALDSGETVRRDHVDLARGLLASNFSLDERTLKELHSLLLGRELDYAGQFRDILVRVGGSSLETDGLASVPEPDQVRQQLAAVLEAWAQAVMVASALPPKERLDHILRFHIGLLQVHPFFDGNGLLARVLLAVHTEEHLGIRVMLPRRDAAYFRALRQASQGNYDDLLRYVKIKMDDAVQHRLPADGAPSDRAGKEAS
ncbi:MAG: Fic family protein [Candidatus Tectomicrobia bacterium]|uniref:Fic family protein n=1 Tax=Tectimicrobiota bacterium TaxID=2528274 RepID=A0A932MNI2_UNCTE|nr:Fic family protein [Candidatus Tectomicrobia bacterium]